MITEDYCSFEVANLLKEKGFDEPCTAVYEEKILRINTLCDYRNSELSSYVCAPTHQMAVKWLREKHNILISVIPQEIKVGVGKLCYAIYRITEDVYTPLYNGYINNLVDSYEEAAEAALKYSLENLI